MGTAPTPLATPQPSLWRRILGGALVGLSGGLMAPSEHPEESVGLGAQAVENAQDRELKRRLLISGEQRAQEQMGMEKQRLAMEADRHKLSMAHLTIQIQEANRRLSLLPVDKQEAYEDEIRTKVSAPLAKEGYEFMEGDDYTDLLTESAKRSRADGNFNYPVLPSPVTKGKYALFTVPASNIKTPVTVEFGPKQKITFPAGSPISNVLQAQTQAFTSRMQRDTQLQVALIQQKTALMTSGAGTITPDTVRNYAERVTSGQMKFTEVPSQPRGLKNLVSDAIAQSGSLVVPPAVRDKLSSMNAAKAVLDKFEQTLNEYLVNKTPNNALRLRAEREAFTRILGRAMGEKGVFTDYDKADFARVLGPGLTLTTVDPSLARQQIDDLRDVLANVQMRHLQSSFKTFKSSPTEAAPSGTPIYDINGNPVK